MKAMIPSVVARPRQLSFHSRFLSQNSYNHTSKMTPKSRVLIIGTGGIGTVSAYSLEKGGKAEVTAVMRSNYDAAVKNGINLDSIQYGKVKGWKPTASM